MQDSMPILICDDEDGCGEVVTDFYGQSASSVDGTRVTQTERAPGWHSSERGDFCPDHHPTDHANGGQA